MKVLCQFEVPNTIKRQFHTLTPIMYAILLQLFWYLLIKLLLIFIILIFFELVLFQTHHIFFFFK